jgi:ligand-binding SRPBCC domain-containing protein
MFDRSLKLLCRRVIQSEAIVIDRILYVKKRDRSLNPWKNVYPFHTAKGHLQVLTPKVIDHISINKIFDRSQLWL